MKTRLCKKCNKHIPCTIVVNGTRHNIASRKYCLTCSPFKQHNTKVLSDNEEDNRRKANSQKVINWRKRTKIKAVEHKGGKCEKCGYDKCIQALAFHHLDPKKKDFAISGVSKSWETIVSELDKCILVCANCHAEIHASLN